MKVEALVIETGDRRLSWVVSENPPLRQVKEQRCTSQSVSSERNGDGKMLRYVNSSVSALFTSFTSLPSGPGSKRLWGTGTSNFIRSCDTRLETRLFRERAPCVRRSKVPYFVTSAQCYAARLSSYFSTFFVYAGRIFHSRNPSFTIESCQLHNLFEWSFHIPRSPALSSIQLHHRRSTRNRSETPAL